VRNAHRIEDTGQVPKPDRLFVRLDSKGPRQIANDLIRRHSAFSEGRYARIAMPFRQTPPISSNDKRHMEEFRFSQSKRTVEEYLLRRGRKQIIASHDTGWGNFLAVACIAGLFAIRKFLVPKRELSHEMATVKIEEDETMKEEKK
jgi:hypothetical protein